MKLITLSDYKKHSRPESRKLFQATKKQTRKFIKIKTLSCTNHGQKTSCFALLCIAVACKRLRAKQPNQRHYPKNPWTKPTTTTKLATTIKRLKRIA
jgi:hypothetical protein